MDSDDVLQLVNADQFLNSLPDDPCWAIEPLAMEGGILMIHAREGVGKSSLATQLAHSFIVGEPWIGFDVPESGPVIYLNLDMAEHEMGRLIERGRAAGFELREDFYLPPLEEGFNILEDSHAQTLEDYCREIQPACVILDTADDGYWAHETTNQLIRHVLKRYRYAVSPGLFVFLHHDRKKSKPGFRGGDQDDEDAYLGRGAWSRVSTSRLHLKEQDNGLKLVIRKARIEEPGFKELDLNRTEHGFFELTSDHQQMLRLWPNNIPPGERAEVLSGIESLSDVFADIASRTGSQQDTVRKQFYRAEKKGARFEWRERLDL